MDVSRGDRVMEPGQAVELNGARTWYVVGPCHRYLGNTVIQNGNGDLRSAPPTALSPVPPDVVTPPDYSFGEALEYRTSVGPWLPAKWVGVDPVNEGMGVLRNDSNKGANVVTVGLHDIRRPLPDVVTLTLSYRGHEVSEEMEADELRLWASRPAAVTFRSAHVAARALAEKVDGEDQ